MSNLMKRDNNELRYNAILLLQKEGNSNYYKNLLRNTKNFFYGMNRPDLLEELEKIIKEKLEDKIGANIIHILFIYKNLLYLNSFTKSKLAGKETEYIYKYDIENWLDEIENWIFKTIVNLEPQIRLTIPPKQYV